jgi:hypothetical protein
MNFDVVDIIQHVHLMEVLLYKELNGVIMKNNIGPIQIYEKVEVLMDINFIIKHLFKYLQFLFSNQFSFRVLFNNKILFLIQK